MRVVLLLFVLALATSWAKPVRKSNKRPKMFNKDLFEGDIKLVKGQDRNAVPRDDQRWPGGIIPYAIKPNVDHKIVRLVLEATDYLSKRTCLKFVERTNENDYISIFEGDGCWANWGNVGGEQQVSLDSEGCDLLGTVIHELLHAVGFEHEHNRADRDDYLKIFWDNIEEDFHDQFQKHQPDGERRLTDFDYESIMLYGSTAFGIQDENGELKTVMVRKDNDGILEDWREYPSQSDIKRVNMLYKCKPIEPK